MKFTNIVRVGRIVSPVKEDGVVQKMQVQTSAWELTDDVNSMQMYGFASSPLVGADVVIVNMGADNSNGNIVATNDQTHRPKNMLGGETIVYDDKGQSIYISKKNGKLSIVVKAGNEIDISCDTLVNITAPLVVINGDLRVTGKVTGGYGTADSVGLQSHTHTQNSDGHGDSEAPTNAPTAGT